MGWYKMGHRIAGIEERVRFRRAIGLGVGGS